MKIESKTVHWGDRRKAGNFIPVTTPIYTASSYVYESMDQLDRVFALEESGPSYARYDNPTRSALEELVRELESGAGAIACASGMAGMHMAHARRADGPAQTRGRREHDVRRHHLHADEHLRADGRRDGARRSLRSGCLRSGAQRRKARRSDRGNHRESAAARAARSTRSPRCAAPRTCR